MLREVCDLSLSWWFSGFFHSTGWVTGEVETRGPRMAALIQTASRVNRPALFWQENGKSRLQQAQEDVKEVEALMLDNLNKANERSGKLDDLEDRADQLLEKVWIRCMTRAESTSIVSVLGALKPGNVILKSINTREAELERKRNVHFTSWLCFMALFLERYFLLFPKMNEISWSPWVRRREARTCHEANVHPGVNKRVAPFPRRYLTEVKEK